MSGTCEHTTMFFNERLLLLTLPARLSWQVDEIYHDESLGTHINIALVRLIMVGYRQVSTPC